MRFDAAAMLNLSPDHLDRHGDMAGYAAAKRAIFDRQELGDLAVVGTDDAPSRAMAADLTAITVSGEHRADVWFDGGTLQDAAGPILRMAEAPALPGRHNAQNAAAAAAIALHLGLGRAPIAAGLRSFPGLPHRQQLVATVGGVRLRRRQQGHQRRRRRPRARLLRPHRLDRRRGRQGRRHRPARAVFPRVAHALLIGQDGPALAAQLGGVPHDVVGTLDAGGRRRARTPPAAPAPRWCCCRRPAPPSTSSAASRRAAAASPSWCTRSLERAA